jgi:hypothetical protein
MDELIKHNEYIQSLGMAEVDAWLMMLEDTKEAVKDAYKSSDVDAVNNLNKDIDFIQRQLVRLSQRFN